MSTNPHLSKLFTDPPKLHFWSNEFQLGGFDGPMLFRLHQMTLSKLPKPAVVLETGAGLSTLMFLAAGAEKVVTVSLDPAGGELEGRIRQWAEAQGMSTDALEYINVASELVLPDIAKRGLQADICMIDGGHGWPTVFVDFCYMNMCLKQGGFLVVDDLALFSVAQLAALLRRQQGWSVVGRLNQKTLVFRKDNDRPMMPDFGGQPYIVQNSLFNGI